MELKEKLDALREPMLSRKLIRSTVKKVSTTAILKKFSYLRNNIVVIGDKAMCIAYAKHKMSNYTTGIKTRQFSWSNIINELETNIKKYCTIGSTVSVYHHQWGFLADVIKTGAEIYVPHQVQRQLSLT